jgi:hypothetical protein
VLGYRVGNIEVQRPAAHRSRSYEFMAGRSDGAIPRRARPPSTTLVRVHSVSANARRPSTREWCWRRCRPPHSRYDDLWPIVVGDAEGIIAGRDPRAQGFPASQSLRHVCQRWPARVGVDHATARASRPLPQIGRTRGRRATPARVPLPHLVISAKAAWHWQRRSRQSAGPSPDQLQSSCDSGSRHRYVPARLRRRAHSSSCNDASHQEQSVC